MGSPIRLTREAGLPTGLASGRSLESVLLQLAVEARPGDAEESGDLGDVPSGGLEGGCLGSGGFSQCADVERASQESFDLAVTIGDRHEPLRLVFIVSALAEATSKDRPLGLALAEEGPLDRLLHPEGPVMRILREDGALDRLLAEDGPVDRLLTEDGALETLVAEDGPLERLLLDQESTDRSERVAYMRPWLTSVSILR